MNKVFLTLPTLLTTITTAPILAIVGYKITTNNNISNSITNNDISTPSEVKPLVPSVANMYNPKLSSRNGPIVFWKEKITSLDWFGAERWSIDVTTIQMNGIHPLKDNGNNGTSWIRYWLNYELDKTNDILYILSNAKKNAYQYIVSIDVKTGALLNCYNTAKKMPNKNTLNDDAFFRIKVLSNGNVAFFGLAGHIGDNKDIVDIVDVKTGVTTRHKGNINNSIAPRPTATAGSGHNYSTSRNATFNLIPIGVNRNLLCIYNLTSKPTIGDGGAAWGTSQVWFILVDDAFHTISTASNGWEKAKLVTDAIPNTRNSKIVPQIDYHVLLDGRVVTVIYDKLVIIDPTNLNDPKLTISALEKDKWIESWSFDSSETLFFKERDGTKIKQVKLDSNKNNTTNPNHVISQYYNLSESPINEIKEAANTLILYNVYGYIGQIMLINSQFQEGIKDSLYPSETQIKEKKYGLAVAITNNKNAIGQGDTKGLLNTENAFSKSADFDITNDVLNKKLPSEITKGDITFLNESFLTTNNTKNENGSLKYEPFVKNEIDDNKKTLKLTLNLDQIPWFVTDGKVPLTIAPLTITKEFNFNVEISSRFSWKQVDKDDYDFRNTLPTKMTISDIERISPLVSTLTSQIVTINNKNYPRTEYKILEKDDDVGKIKIQAKYEYLPMELKAIDSNLKSYTLEKEYIIFKNSTDKKLTFVGNGQSDVSKIPELKEIKESNILPSSFINASKQEYLKFIDTNNSFGYPLEKMKISATPDDTNGTLTINIDPKEYDSTLSITSKKFIGLNKTNSYKLNFKESDSSFKKLDYLPSEINEEIFYKNFLTFSGFDSSDFELYLYPNDVTGQLTANIILMGNYPSGPTANSDFKKENNQWIARKTFSGFKTINDYNKEYQLTFKKDNSPSLSVIQKFTPSEIQNKLSSESGLSISSNTYKNVKQLIGLFIESKGSELANINIEESSDVEVEMHINNGGGEITWRITYNKLEGYSNPITFLQTIGGFAKGNDVPTKDVLTLKNNNQLQLSKSDYFKQLPSQIKEKLDTNPKLIQDFFLNEPTGGYKTAFDENKFKLVVIADDNTGKLNVRIIFEKDGTNIQNESLLEYSQMYSGFNYQ